MTDQDFEKAEEFLKKFKDLVRSFVPVYTEESVDLLYLMQERTSVFNPYVWSDDAEDPFYVVKKDLSAYVEISIPNLKDIKFS